MQVFNNLFRGFTYETVNITFFRKSKMMHKTFGRVCPPACLPHSAYSRIKPEKVLNLLLFNILSSSLFHSSGKTTLIKAIDKPAAIDSKLHALLSVSAVQV